MNRPPTAPAHPDRLEVIPDGSSTPEVSFTAAQGWDFGSLPDFDLPTHTVQLGQWTCSYVQTGPAEGPVVVLVHGNPTWSYLWRHLLRALGEAGFRAIALDHIGMGRSQRPPRGAYTATLSQRISDFDQFIAAVVPQGRFALVAHDWGGPISIGWGAEHANRLSHLVVMNTAGFSLPAGMTFPLSLRLARSRPLGILLTRRTNAFARATLRWGCSARLPQPVRRGYLAPYTSARARMGIVGFLRDIPVRARSHTHTILRRTEEQLPALDHVPTLVCWGMRDPVFNQRILTRWRELMPQAQVLQFDQVGHLIPEEAAPALADLLPAFLRDHPTEEDASRHVI